MPESTNISEFKLFMPYRMYNFDWSLGSSLIALVLVQVNQSIHTDFVMQAITAVSALVFCLTGVVRFIDLIIEKRNKWRNKTKN